jgi:prolyl 4-hydroxylase
MKKIEYHKEIFIIEDFLSKSECDELISISEDIGFEEAKIQTGNNEQLIVKGIRNNDRILYESQHLAEKFFGKSKPFLEQNIGLYEIKDLNEMFRFYKYSVGQRFKMHRDGSFERNNEECSFYTFLIYLNDDFVGGETEFKDLFTIKPKTGSLLVFLHPHKHEGKILLKGNKYALRSDVMYKLNN